MEAQEKIKDMLVRAALVDGFAQYITPETIDRIATKISTELGYHKPLDRPELEKKLAELCLITYDVAMYGGVTHRAKLTEGDIAKILVLCDTKKEILSGTEIGDNLDLEVEATYPCSDGGKTTTVSVDKLLQAQLDKGE